jgi:ABC-type transporter Mla subunit MlaD
MEPMDLTIEILKDIRDETRGMRIELSERIDQTNERLDKVCAELKGEIRELRQAQVATETRLATALTDVVGALEDVKTLLRENYASTIRDLDRRVTALESRVGT